MKFQGKKMFNFGTLKQIVFPVNVGKRNGKTFIAGVNNVGNHWVLIIVELRPFKRIVYCDTLAWDPPSNMLDLVNSYADHIPSVGGYGDNQVSTAHSPAASTNLGHQCDWRCRNYPLQTCSDMSGVVVLIMPLWRLYTNPSFNTSLTHKKKRQSALNCQPNIHTI